MGRKHERLVAETDPVVVLLVLISWMKEYLEHAALRAVELQL